MCTLARAVVLAGNVWTTVHLDVEHDISIDQVLYRVSETCLEVDADARRPLRALIVAKVENNVKTPYGLG